MRRASDPTVRLGPAHTYLHTYRADGAGADGGAVGGERGGEGGGCGEDGSGGGSVDARLCGQQDGRWEVLRGARRAPLGPVADW